MSFNGPPNKNFPGPKYNQVIQDDPQIIKINEDHMEWGAPKNQMPGVYSKGFEGSIEHTKSKG